MRLATEQWGEGQDLVFIHGWGANSALWQPWIEAHFIGYRITLIDLPGHGQSPQLFCADEQVLDTWLNALVAVLPARASLVGWSLGGLLAQQIAWRYPERITSLLLMTTSPCFVQREDWLPALAKPLFARYLTEVMGQTQSLLKSFFSLQALGSQQPKQLLKQLIPLMTQVMSGHQLSLRQGLLLLQTLDMRHHLSLLPMPSLWLFADADAIVPISLMAEIPHWQPQAQYQLIEASGHVPFLAQPEKTAQAMVLFLQGRLHD